MTEPKLRVFLSYARTDRARVSKIAEALVAAGLNVWWDTAIAGGSSFSADIARELDAADVVVVVWSAASVKSDWVLDEAGAGRDRKRLVPVQIDATPPALGFRQLQTIDLSAWTGRGSDPAFKALVDAVHRIADAPTPVPIAVPAAAKALNRRAVIGGAAAVVAVGAGGFGAWQAMGGRTIDDGTASVAVLPFANLSGDPAQAFFSDGIAEELRNALSQIRGLKVIGRVSSEQFRDADDLSAVAEKLGVDHILTGSVRRSPSTIRIGAQLVDGKTGVESWSQSYDQPVGDALAIQSSIASNVVAALSQQLGKAVGTVSVGGTKNPAAQELFLKAEALANDGGSEVVLNKRLALLDAAIALDPVYAEAHAARSLVVGGFANEKADSVAEREAMFKDAMASARRAVALAPMSGYARTSLALRYNDLLDFRRAIAEGDAALRLAPGDGRVVSDFTRILASSDPDRAAALQQDVVASDPLNVVAVNRYASYLTFTRRYAEAASAGAKAMTMSENRLGAGYRGWGLLLLGQYDAARKLMPYIDEEWARLTLAAMLEARAGNRAASDTALAGLRKIDDGTLHYQFAQVHAQRGEIAAALASIEAAQKTGDPGIVDIAVDSFLDPLRKEPRFKAVQDSIIPPDLFVPPKRG